MMKSKENEKKLSKQQKTSIKTYDCLVKNDYLNKVNYENDKEFYNLHYDEILEKSGMETKSLNTLLMRMELKGIIKKSANYYSK